MARFSNEFIKVELRLLDDHRFFELSELEQLMYLKLLVIAKKTENHIPKKYTTLKGLLRSNRSETELHSVLTRLKESFPKFNENKYFWYFRGLKERMHKKYENKYTDIRHKTKDIRHKTEDKDKDKDTAFGKVPFNLFALINAVKKELGWAQERRIPDSVVTGVCKQYERDRAKITSPYPWFRKVIKEELRNFHANRNIEESIVLKGTPPQDIKDMIKGIGK